MTDPVIQNNELSTQLECEHLEICPLNALFQFYEPFFKLT